jgi:hypothetical protein
LSNGPIISTHSKQISIMKATLPRKNLLHIRKISLINLIILQFHLSWKFRYLLISLIVLKNLMRMNFRNCFPLIRPNSLSINQTITKIAIV